MLLRKNERKSLAGVSNLYYLSATARDYETRLEYVASKATALSTDSWKPGTYVEAIGTWGKPFDAGHHGWRVFVSSRYDDRGALFSEVNFSAPFYTGTATVSSSIAWWTSKIIVVRVKGLTFTAGSWAFTDFELEIDGVVVWSYGGSWSNTVTSYDVRYNCAATLTARAWEDIPPPIPRNPGCAESYSSQTEYSRLITGGFNSSGWRYRTTAGPGAWTESTIDLDTALAPGAAACPGTSCTLGFDTMSVAASSCYQVRGDFDYSYQLSKTYDGNDACEGGVNNWERWHIDENQYYRTTKDLATMPTDAGILVTRRETYAVCTDGTGGSPTTSDVTTTEAHTFARFLRTVWRSVNYQECTRLIPGPGPEVLSDGGSPLPCFTLDVDHCLYVAWARLTHPESPETGATDVSIDMSHSNRFARVVIRAGIIHSEIAGNRVPIEASSVETGVSADRLCGVWKAPSSDQTIWVLYTDSGSLKEAYSVDGGSTYSVSRTIGSATDAAATISRANQRHNVWIDGGTVKGEIVDAADNVIESTFTISTGADDYGISLTSLRGEGQVERFVLNYIAGGSLIEKISVDGGLTYT